MFTHVEQSNEDLNRKALDQVKGEALEVVHFNEFVQVNRQHLKSQHQVLSKYEVLMLFNDVFLVFRVVLV
jgi:hypothetical protein